MSIRIYSKLAENVSVAEEKICAKLVSSGAIYNLFVECCRPDRTPTNQVFLAKNKKTIVGWAIIKRDHKTKWQFMVYVKKPYRRKGIGTRLYIRAKKYSGASDDHISVFRTDNQNKNFFDSVRKCKN